ncbi:Asp-tRNA(Asn)/Glu-tRNA(Gln) amidotransferase GatCAB subunit C [bacterium]|nr:MAG: Asp-tRNA(Asn)/Glu-tRNA(Gln) amidotransferase GatCAB subunit C [bacterium]
MDKELVKHIAELARIELTDKEENLFAGQLQSVLDYFELLKEIDTSAITVDVTKSCNTEQTRLDNQESLDRDFDRDVLLGNVPEMEGEAVKVKGVF